MLIPNLSVPEDIRHESHYVDAYLNQKHLGIGSLYIAESRVSWTKENSAEGLALDYPNIAIHAVSKDTTNFQFPCLYLMLDIDIDDSNDQDDDSDEEEDKPEMTEIRFVPRDEDLLDFMYKALNDCQVLHPAGEDDYYGEDEGDFEVRVGNADDHVGVGEEENMDDGVESDMVSNGVNGDHQYDENSDENNADVDMGQFEDVDH